MNDKIYDEIQANLKKRAGLMDIAWGLDLKNVALMRKHPKYVDDCPVCSKPMVDSDGFDALLIGGDNKRYHDKCFFGRYGHID